LCELTEECGANADDDREDQHLDAGGNDIAEHALGEKRGLAEQAERHQDKARERRELELDQGDEELHGQNEECDQDHEPGDQQHEDLDEVFEERHEAHQLAGGLQDGLAGIDPDLCEPPGLQELIWRKA
jgi:hypothetical protein